MESEDVRAVADDVGHLEKKVHHHEHRLSVLEG